MKSGEYYIFNPGSRIDLMKFKRKIAYLPNKIQIESEEILKLVKECEL